MADSMHKSECEHSSAANCGIIQVHSIHENRLDILSIFLSFRVDAWHAICNILVDETMQVQVWNYKQKKIQTTRHRMAWKVWRGKFIWK